MIVLFLSILILTSLQSFWFWMKWPIYPLPSNNLQPTMELDSFFPDTVELLIPGV